MIMFQRRPNRILMRRRSSLRGFAQERPPAQKLTILLKNSIEAPASRGRVG